MGWQGQIAEGMTAYEELLGRVDAAEDGPQLERIRMAHGWLRLVRGDVVGARASLAMTAPAALRAGLVRIAVWSFSWLAYAEFVLGAWDEAAADAERAVSLLDESGMEWLRPLARYAAVLVPAARGEWEAAEEHLRGGCRAARRLRADGGRRPRWPAPRWRRPAASRRPCCTPWSRCWRSSRGPGSTSPGSGRGRTCSPRRWSASGRLDEAEALLAPHEELAAGRGRGGHDGPAGRGRADGWRPHAGRLPQAEAAYRRALDALGRAVDAVRAAQVELAYGQSLRRGGQRRAAADAASGRPRSARRAAGRPSWSAASGSCAAVGSHPPSAATSTRAGSPRRSRRWPGWSAVGMSNRQVAAELFVSIKTVQFHLTHIYAKLGISSRAELAAQFRE